MEYRLSETCGFCFGVRRAVEMAEDIAAEKRQIYTWGPLIHNPQEVDRLRDLGVETTKTIEAGMHLLIRSHGAGPRIYKEAAEMKIILHDATCPKVKKAQKIAQKRQAAGYDLVIAGDPKHPEVQGIVGWLQKENTYVVDSVSAAEELPEFAKCALISQTTQNRQKFLAITEVLSKKAKDFVVDDTICSATFKRQTETAALAARSDVMLVIGGKNSSNSRKLYMIAREICQRTYQIESVADISVQWFKKNDKIGITAGASTPGWIIKEVVEEMSDIKEQDLEELTMEELMKMEEKQQHHYGDIITGKVVQINRDDLLVNIGGKSEGVIRRGELMVDDETPLTEKFTVDEEIEVMFLKQEDEEGRPVLSKKRVDQQRNWKKLEADFENENILNGTVKEVIKGGLIVDLGLDAFLPASLVDVRFVKDMNNYAGRDLAVKIIEFDSEKRKLVVSAKAVLEEKIVAEKKETLDKLEEGQIVKGTVRNVTKYGAFIDLGGIEGLLHVSEMAWYHIKNPASLLKTDDVIDVYVINVDKDKEKIALGLKQIKGNPWEKIEEKYPMGEIVEGKVVSTAVYGAFVELEEGLEGLVHISKLSSEHVKKTEDVVKKGDKVLVKVLDIDKEAKRISLSIKDAVQEDEVPEPEQKEETSSEETFTEEEDFNVTIGDLINK